MNLLEILGINNKPCAICAGDLPIRGFDPEIGGMCYECTEFDSWAEALLLYTPGICKPTQPNVR